MSNNNQFTILIIEDELFLRHNFSNFLQDLGYKTTTAENGKIGIEKFKKENIDLILVDLRMPVMDGLQVLKEISKINIDIPQIVISGTGVINDVIEALRLGAWDYLMKPIDDMAILKHAVEKNLEKASMKKMIFEYQKHLEQKIEERTVQLKNKNIKLKNEIDIRKKTEEKLTRLLEEKSLLIQEIHHRVKNNMATIVSLLHLKASVLSEEYTKEILLDCENRVRTMAFVHESLYKRDNLRFVKLKDYTKKIVTDILGCYRYLNNQIQVAFDIDEIHMSLDQLVSFGLIINEIITNSAKHAFKDLKNPKISVSIKNIDDVMLKVIISDNGIGFKGDIKSDFNNTTGFKVIRALIQELQGTISCKSDNGVVFEIEIPHNEIENDLITE